MEDTGAHLRQLRDILVELDYLEASGSGFDWATQVAVKAWQKKLGAPQTGSVKLGELVVVKKAPASINFDTDCSASGRCRRAGRRCFS